MPSPIVAPRSRPCSESPAWKMTGWPCGDRETLSGPATWKCSPRWLSWCCLVGSRKVRVDRSRGNGVFLVGVPQALGDPDELQAAGVAGVVVEVLVAAEVRRRAGVAAGDDVPAGPSAADQVEGGQAAGHVERVVVGRGHGGDQAQVPGGHRQRRQQRHRLEPVEVVRRGVGGDELAVDDEDQVELGRLGQPGLLDVPVDVDAGVAGDLRVEPEVVLAGAARAHGDGAELELPLPRGHAGTAFGRGRRRPSRRRAGRPPRGPAAAAGGRSRWRRCTGRSPGSGSW